MKELKIIPAIMLEADGLYNPVDNTIYYNSLLDDFPKLKEFVINHEKKHAKYKYNYFGHMWIDIIDYRYSVTKDYFEYMLAKEDKYKLKASNMKLRYLPAQILYWIVAMLAGVFWMIPAHFMHWYYLLTFKRSEALPKK